MAIQLKRSLTSDINPNYILAQGQIGIEMPSVNNLTTNPFKIKIGDGSTQWQDLPYVTENVISANKLQTGRYIKVRLDETTLEPFNGTKDIQTSVLGTLPVIRGGTGCTSLEDLKTALGLDSSSGSDVEYLPLSGFSNNDSSNRKKWTNFNLGVYEWTTSGTIKQTGNSTHLELTSKYLVLTRRSSSSSCPACNLAAQILTSGVSYWDNNSSDNKVQLGNAGARWKTIYAGTGTIQTSDARDKFHISYITQANAAQVDTESPTDYNPDLSTIIDFVNNIEPVTFCYKSDLNSENDAHQSLPSEIQLGLIAQDLQNHPLFPYIGSHEYWEELPAEYDDLGNEIRPKLEAGERFGLKPLPVAVAALTACKYLLLQIENIQSQLDSISK